MMIHNYSMRTAGKHCFTVNKAFFSNICCICAIILLGTNSILYSFFKIENSSRLIIRIFAGLLLIFSIILSGKITYMDLAFSFFATYMLFIGGVLTQNIAYILVATIALKGKTNAIWKRVSDFQIVLVGIVLSSLLFGVVPNITSSHLGRVRSNLGFTNVNAASIFFYSASLLWLLTLKRVKWVHHFIAISGSIIVFRMTSSRTAFGSIIVFYICYFYLKQWHGKHTQIVLAVMEVLCFLFPFFGALFIRYAPQYDYFLSNRLSYFYSYFIQNGAIELLFGGSDIKEIDNFYLLLLFNSGLIFYLFTAFETIFSSIELLKQKKLKEVSYIISILALGIMESGPLRCEIICMLFFWFLVFDTPKKAASISNSSAKSM